jgi:hypothetical protein
MFPSCSLSLAMLARDVVIVHEICTQGTQGPRAG